MSFDTDQKQEQHKDLTTEMELFYSQHSLPPIDGLSKKSGPVRFDPTEGYMEPAGLDWKETPYEQSYNTTGYSSNTAYVMELDPRKSIDDIDSNIKTLCHGINSYLYTTKNNLDNLKIVIELRGGLKIQVFTMPYGQPVMKNHYGRFSWPESEPSLIFGCRLLAPGGVIRVPISGIKQIHFIITEDLKEFAKHSLMFNDGLHTANSKTSTFFESKEIL